MKKFLQWRSRRWGYDGWAVVMDGATRPLAWTTCTTREEVRELIDEHQDMFLRGCDIKKVKITVEVIEDEQNC